MLLKWKRAMKNKGLKINMERTKILVSSSSEGEPVQSVRHSCAVCGSGVGVNFVRNLNFYVSGILGLGYGFKAETGRTMHFRPWIHVSTLLKNLSYQLLIKTLYRVSYLSCYNLQMTPNRF